MQRRRGLHDPAAERFAAEGRRPMREHVRDSRACLEAKGDTAEQVNLTLARLARVIESCNAERVGDLGASAVATVVANLQVEGLSLRTCNGYLQAVKTFSRWLRRGGQLFRSWLGIRTRS